jgi:drug/metabolite transporter (DMT)-like permease
MEQRVLFYLGIVLILVGAGLIVMEDFSLLQGVRPYSNRGFDLLETLKELLGAIERLLKHILPAQQKTHGVFLVLCGGAMVGGSLLVSRR